MKKISLIIIALALFTTGCSKEGLTETAPGNNDPNYDVNKRVFRVQASSTDNFNLTVVEYTASNEAYNTENADQSTAFDYGFTPVIGHTVKVTLQSSGALSATMLYKGVILDPVKINSTGDGSNATYVYTVTN
ncbi:hypothetical protein [Mucilaginibacter sp. FT3.2]|uniref:hypothetical protein n=1 Tax=Mucilaginibacter sp. FT3.2 TaxID=2723090 RepID=UPI001618D6F2|nr:hypothetical protein [Mucilaginibacter sp. FT3.2]MBB6234177.1 hypothetical protein [Mucilaginibacter sp. FT3.2]